MLGGWGRGQGAAWRHAEGMSGPGGPPGRGGPRPRSPGVCVCCNVLCWQGGWPEFAGCALGRGKPGAAFPATMGFGRCNSFSQDVGPLDRPVTSLSLFSGSLCVACARLTLVLAVRHSIGWGARPRAPTSQQQQAAWTQPRSSHMRSRPGRAASRQRHQVGLRCTLPRGIRSCRQRLNAQIGTRPGPITPPPRALALAGRPGSASRCMQPRRALRRSEGCKRAAPPLLARPAECKLHELNCFLSEGKRSHKEASSITRKLVVACVLCFIFMIVEVIGGYLADRWATPQTTVCGCWVLGAGCWVLGAGCWVLGAGCWVLGAGCSAW
jgi:hypothetical protein